MRAARPLRSPPCVAILLELESTVGVRVIACTDLDEARLWRDLQHRDLAGELDAALQYIHDKIDRLGDAA